MLFVTVSQPKKKLKILIKVLVVCIFLIMIMPAVLDLFSAGEQVTTNNQEKSEYPGEPIRVNGENSDLIESLSVWEAIVNHYSF